MPLDAEIATPDGKRRFVRALFATIADRYDLITRLLSYGQDQRWKLRLAAMVDAAPGARAVDLATGTGDIARLLERRGVPTIGLDLTPRMIELARLQPPLGPATPRFLVGDMCALPFTAAAFDIVTTGYGLRNVPDLAGAIAEVHRVLRPGGQALSLDFNKPKNRVVRAAYLAYLTVVGATLGWTLHGDSRTYRYIPASIRRYPGAEGVADMMRAGGFTDVRVIPVLGGLMAIHVGRKLNSELRT